MTSKEDGGEDAAVGVGNAGSDPGRNDKDSNSGVCNTAFSKLRCITNTLKSHGMWPHTLYFLLKKHKGCSLAIFPLDVCILSGFSLVRLFATLWTAAFQVPLSMGFSRQEYWSELPLSPPGDLPDPEIEPTSLMPLASAD